MDLQVVFKADISGWLEYKNKRTSTGHSNQPLQVSDSSIALEQLFESLDSTLAYYKYSTKALEALHTILFYNVIHRRDYAVDFNVVNFPAGLDHYLLYHVCERFGLHKYTCYELWKMPAEDALSFILETSLSTLRPLRHLHHIFFKLIQKNTRFKDISDDTLQDFIINQIRHDSGNDLVSHHLPYILQTIYDCILENVQTAKKCPEQFELIEHSTARLLYIVDTIGTGCVDNEDCCLLVKMIYQLSGKALPSYLAKATVLPCISIPIQTCQNVRIQQHDLEYDWHKLMQQQDTNTTAHEKAFLVICWHLQNKCLVSSNIQANDEKSGFDRLEQSIRRKVDKQSVASCQLWCIFNIRNRASFWKSVLKVVVQFMDLWIQDIIDTQCGDLYASLIAKENMMAVLYSSILKQAQHYQRNQSHGNLSTIKNMCQILEISIDNANSMDDLILFRDEVLKQRQTTDDIYLPTFGSLDVWNIPFQRELTKVLNQITAVDDDDDSQYHAPEDAVVAKLVKLSIICPLQVIQELFRACVCNKNQFKAIIPVLSRLGDISRFRKTSACSSLLMTAIRDVVLELQNINSLISNQENITQFIKGCLANHFTKKYPIILTPRSLLIDQETTNILLDLTEVLNNFILPPLVAFTQKPETSNTELARFSLHLLSSFCQYPPSALSSGWDTVGRATNNESDLPAILYCSPETFVHCLTFIMNLREQEEVYSVQLEDWESALSCINKLGLIIRGGITALPSQFGTLQQYFETSLDNFGWKAQLLWYPFIKKRSLRVPKAFFQITGSLNGLFEAEEDDRDDDKMVGWHQLFTACKLSTELTDALFQYHIQWEYNLLLLWKHPIENEIVQNGFRLSLHPSLSKSVSNEYPKLLDHFLSQLYNSFDFDAVLRDEQYYTDKNILPIISQLSRNQGTRLYFVILCIVQLLKTQIQIEANKKDWQDLYYVSCLIKAIQDITHWGNISKDGQAASYNKLKDKLNQEHSFDEIKDVNYCYYYPLLNTDKLKSDRALSILTLYHLSTLTIHMNQAESEITQRLVMQIVEGLVDMSSRQQFERMLQQQPKKRVANWKKKSKSSNSRCKQMRLRPILTNEETHLLKPVLLAQPVDWNKLLQILGLVVDSSKDQNDSKNTLYFL